MFRVSFDFALIGRKSSVLNFKRYLSIVQQLKSKRCNVVLSRCSSSSTGPKLVHDYDAITGSTSEIFLDNKDKFVYRHVGPREKDQKDMLKYIGCQVNIYTTV